MCLCVCVCSMLTVRSSIHITPWGTSCFWLPPTTAAWAGESWVQTGNNQSESCTWFLTKCSVVPCPVLDLVLVLEQDWSVRGERWPGGVNGVCGTRGCGAGGGEWGWGSDWWGDRSGDRLGDGAQSTILWHPITGKRPEPDQKPLTRVPQKHTVTCWWLISLDWSQLSWKERCQKHIFYVS